MADAANYDVIIVGAGSAGCALAARLSEDSSRRVLLIECGPDDTGFNPGWLSRMPKGLARLVTNPAHIHSYVIDPTARPDNSGPDLLIRGKMMGGSSAINGMVYHRGQPEDYDLWAGLGNPGWGWSDMLPYLLVMENHLDLPATQWRGSGGPISLTVSSLPARLAKGIFEAGDALGLPRKEEANLLEQQGLSPIVANIDAQGRRVSAARAFLTPSVRARPNLDIATNVSVNRILFNGRRVGGVQCTRDGEPTRYMATREVILSAGALQSPALLQLSGVGDSSRLSAMGIDVVHHNPNVGRNMLDHWNCYSGFDLFHHQDSHNREFRGWRLIWNVLRYQFGFRGALAASTHILAGFDKVDPAASRPDVGIIMAPYSFAVDGKGRIVPAKQPTMHFYSLGLRPTSEGEVHISSGDPALPP
jgi:choline dehydrogenase